MKWTTARNVQMPAVNARKPAKTGCRINNHTLLLTQKGEPVLGPPFCVNLYFILLENHIKYGCDNGQQQTEKQCPYKTIYRKTGHNGACQKYDNGINDEQKQT